MHKLAFFLVALLWLTGCEDKPFHVASIGNGGSLDGPYILGPIKVYDVLGGGAGFGYGTVNGYPGASASIGKMGVPQQIEGFWAKQNANAQGYIAYYRISAAIDSELAEQKIRTLQNYYQNFDRKDGSMQVLVEGNNIKLLYTLVCVDLYTDCSPRKDSDPNNWVQKSPRQVTDLVVLFDGIGEASTTPFADSPYE